MAQQVAFKCLCTKNPFLANEAVVIEEEAYIWREPGLSLSLSLFPLSHPSSLRSHGNTFAPSQLSDTIFRPKLTHKPSALRKKSSTVVVLSSNSDDPKQSSMFSDENGVVDDMDGYLNYLSLEYDSVWDTKPSWCQPWTITLTGVLIITGSWLVLHSVVISSIALSLIGAWWYIFLYSYPKAYTDMIAERRKKVTNGVEDTFGLRKSQ